ncbi:MAG: hypothetical protein R3174_00575 [Gammaproteobacteria bacterium]|nr:hypothetical protein [Gammaproteobacteria bacterium]
MTTRWTDIYFIRTPVGERDGLVFGGPLRIRVDGLSAYAGFSSPDLAGRVCEHWNMSRNVFIEPWHIAIEHDAPDRRPDNVLFFDDWNTFEFYLRAPGEFPFKKHLVKLHPVPAASPRRSAM